MYIFVKACSTEHVCSITIITRQSLEDRLLDCYIESCEGAPKDKVLIS